MRTKKVLQMISVMVCICMCVACGKGVTEGNEDNSSTANGSNNSIVSGDVINIDNDELPYTQEEIFEQLFDINNFINLVLKEKDK